MLGNLSFNYAPGQTFRPHIRFGAAEAIEMKRLHTGVEVPETVIVDTMRKLLTLADSGPTGRAIIIPVAFHTTDGTPELQALGEAADINITDRAVLAVISAALRSWYPSLGHLEISDPISGQVLRESRTDRGSWDIYKSHDRYTTQQ